MGRLAIFSLQQQKTLYLPDHMILKPYWLRISIQNKNAKKPIFNNTTDITSLASPKTAFGKNMTGGYKVLGIYIDLGLDNEE
jgi:hypothetical protein